MNNSTRKQSFSLRYKSGLPAKPSLYEIMTNSTYTGPPSGSNSFIASSSDYWWDSMWMF